MAAGDFIIRRNNAETDTLPNAGTNLDCAWDTLVYDEGALSYASGAVTVATTAPHLIMFTEQFFTSDTTNNERIEAQGEILINGSPIEQGKCQDYIRKSSGQQECIVSGYAIVELTSGDTVATRYYRTDNSTSGTVTRLSGYGGLQVLELDDTDAFGIYSTTSTRSSTTSMVAVNWDSNDRQDTGLTRTTTEIDLASAGQYLVCISGDATIASTSRIELIGELRLNSTAVVGTRSSCYMRGADGCQDGALSGIYLINASAGDDLSFAFKHITNTVVLGAGFSIQIWKLPVTATSILVEATTGDMNANGNFSWDTNPVTDSDFTHTLGTAAITPNQIGHYLSLSSLGVTTISSVARAYPGVRQSVAGTPIQYGGGGAYHRNSGSTGQIGISSAAILTSVSSAAITTNITPLGASGSVTCQSGQMAVINLSSIYTYSFPPSISDVNTDEQIDLGETNIVITGSDFEAVQGTGKVEIGAASDYTGTLIAQTIDSWSATSIQFDFVQSTLDEGINYVYVTNDTGDTAAGFQVNVGEGPYNVHVLQPADHYWTFNNTHTESVNGNDSDAIILGTPDFVTTPISRSTTHSLRMSGSTDRAETVDSVYMNVTTQHTRRDMGGWIQFDTIPLTPLAIYEEGGGVNNFYFILGFGGILLANCADSSNNFKIQAYSDFKLVINRPYHILFSFQGSAYNNEFRLYIDGVLQSVTDGNPVNNTVMATHSGDLGWGRPDGSLDTGGTDIQYGALTTLLLSNWASWSGTLSELTVSEIRSNLFIQATLAENTLVSSTNSLMQTALEVFDNTSRSNYPCNFKIRGPSDNGGDLTLTATNIIFDAAASIHLLWMGGVGDTLTWRNSGTSNASIVEVPNGGTVQLIETSTITITVKDDDDDSVIENARVLVLSNGAPLPAEDSVTITRVSTTATVSHTGHGMLDGQDVLIRGADQTEYFGKKTITVIDANSYSFTISGSPTTPATGTITSTAIIMFGLTDALGTISSEIDYSADQDIKGYVRSAGVQRYLESPMQGTVTSSPFTESIFLIKN